MITLSEQRERQRRQAQLRRERHRAARDAHGDALGITKASGLLTQWVETEANKSTASQDDENNGCAATENLSEEIDHQNTLWRAYCSFGSKLLRSDELDEFQKDLEGGRCAQVEEPGLMRAAIKFVSELVAGSIAATNWLPAPNDDELNEPSVWIAQRVVRARAEQEVTERCKRWRKKLARELKKDTGRPQAHNNESNAGPVHSQKSKYNLEELARRLENTIAKHKVERGAFHREGLAHRSPNYVRDRVGGIGTKGIIFMANAIVGREERRSYDDNWIIVMNWMNNRQVPQE